MANGEQMISTKGFELFILDFVGYTFSLIFKMTITWKIIMSFLGKRKHGENSGLRNKHLIVIFP